ncbi:MAG: YceI family protein [Bacteroidetes bacterium]|nr:YceI family protein [Bacteroidota bacterium]
MPIRIGIQSNPLWLFMLLLLCMGNSAHNSIRIKKRMHILDGSALLLKGSSNVNVFTCDCNERFPDQLIEADNSGTYVRFSQGELSLPTRKFDCRNRKIDADMQKALDAEHYPYIRIQLQDALVDVRCLHGGCKEWFDVQGNVLITIKNTTRKEFLVAKMKIIGPDQMLLKGEKALQMSSYGIDPPEALFGMIKVNDWITFSFNLNLSTENLP